MKKGFTLIELLVVVLIIGILAAVALPQYTKAVEKSRAAEAMQVLGDLATAEQIYYMSQNEFTQNLNNLDLTFPDISAGTTDTIKTNSWIITSHVGGSGADEFIAFKAVRDGGAYNNQTLAIAVKADGTILRGGTLSGRNGDANGLNGWVEGGASDKNLVPQWK